MQQMRVEIKASESYYYSHKHIMWFCYSHVHYCSRTLKFCTWYQYASHVSKFWRPTIYYIWRRSNHS